MKHKTIWVGGLIGGIVGFIISYLTIWLAHRSYTLNAFIYMGLSILFYILIGLLFGFIKRKYKLKWFIIGGIIGGIWGILSFFMGLLSLEEQASKSFLFLPFYIAYGIIGDRAFLLSPIIGILIGAFIVFLIKKIKEGMK